MTTQNKLFAWPLRLIDNTPMYNVVIFCLGIIFIASLAAAWFGYVGFSVSEILSTGMVILSTAMATSVICSRVTGAYAQHLSSVITALILVLLVFPSVNTFDLFSAGVISALAIASKYVFVYKKQHLLNPVAAGLVLSTFLGFGGAAWWVANPILSLFIITGSLAIVIKVRQQKTFIVFVATAFILYIATMWASTLSGVELLKMFFLSYPYIFLAGFMLTEPFTLPSLQTHRYMYAVFVAAVSFIPSVFFVRMSPELALVIGNIAFAPTSLRQKLFLRLQSKREVAPQIFEFIFTKPLHFQFVAGQYLEWMLPHQNSDDRGIRRYFTVASAPSDGFLRLVFKRPENPSSYKRAVCDLALGGEVVGSQRAGDFSLPKNPAQKIGWIAGGIGVTPFVSQASELSNKKERRDVAMFYCVATNAEILYADILQQSANVVPVVANGDFPLDGESGYLTKEMILTRVPDCLDRFWYVSGPPVMVRAVYKTLRQLSVPENKIIKDFFPGAL